MNPKNTLVIGASENPERYSNKAIRLLKHFEHPVFAIGNKLGEIDGIKIIKDFKVDDFPVIDTITLYVGPNNQNSLFDFIVKTKPQRVIFNPGTENQTLSDLLDANQIYWEEACTLVLLNTNQY